MRVACRSLPPLTGEGAGGDEDRASSPHPNLPPLRGEGVLTSPAQTLAGEGTGARRARTFVKLCLAPAAEFRVPCVAQRITEQVKAQHSQADGQAWENGQPGGLLHERTPSAAQH
jgi:hypothetical protein